MTAHAAWLLASAVSIVWTFRLTASAGICEIYGFQFSSSSQSGMSKLDVIHQEGHPPNQDPFLLGYEDPFSL